MQEERKKILEMVANGKITVEEAERLMAALYDDNGSSQSDTLKSGVKPKYLRVLVEPGPDQTNGERVNIRVPINLIRAGLKFASFIPKHSQKKVHDALKHKGLDIDFSNLTADDVDELIVNLNDLQVEVDGEEIVKVYCE
jgi:hypothetical protein